MSIVYNKVCGECKRKNAELLAIEAEISTKEMNQFLANRGGWLMRLIRRYLGRIDGLNITMKKDAYLCQSCVSRYFRKFSKDK